jgi:hypothetical protein
MHPQHFLWTQLWIQKVKTIEGQGVGALTLACSTLKVKGHVGALEWGLERVISKSITHTDLHKPNNKFVSA